MISALNDLLYYEMGATANTTSLLKQLLQPNFNHNRFSVEGVALLGHDFDSQINEEGSHTTSAFRLILATLGTNGYQSSS